MAFVHLDDVGAELRAELREVAIRLALEAGTLIRDERPESLGVAATKSSAVDVVTVMDQRSEELLRQRLRQLRPDDAILGEEGDDEPGTSGLTWIVDPIDGTVNYLYGHPLYAVSVAVCVGDTSSERGWHSVAGAVFAPASNELFSAAHGQGATLTVIVDAAAALAGVVGQREGSAGRSLRVEAPADLSTALVGTGFGYSSTKRAEQARVLTRLLPQVRDIRRGGSAALDLCYVAAGRLDAYYESGINSWDRAAGQLVAAEAGAALAGPDDELPTKELTVAAAKSLIAPLRACLAE